MSTISQDIGDLPRFAWVDVDTIDIDNNYQRELDGRRVERILMEFHWDHFGSVILAAQAGGRYTVTDGQHRVKAASLHPSIDKVPAMIISRAGTSAEVENFLIINRDRKAVNAVERYWAGLAAGDAASARLRAVLQSAGCDIAPDQGTYKPNLTNSVGALTRAMERYGDRALRQALQTIRKAWPNEAKALRGTLVTSIARIIENNQKIDLDRLASVLRPKRFAEMTAGAEAIRKLSGGSAETALARAIADLYNKGLSVNQIFYGAAP